MYCLLNREQMLVMYLVLEVEMKMEGGETHRYVFHAESEL